MAGDFKPNIYPIMYWGLMYGIIAGFVLFVITFLSTFITIIWFPVFLAGLIWGGYRNYQKQKKSAGSETSGQSPVAEFKEAAQDIVEATREMIGEQVAESQEVESEEEDSSETRPTQPDVESANPVPTPPASPGVPQKSDSIEGNSDDKQSDQTKPPAVT